MFSLYEHLTYKPLQHLRQDPYSISPPSLLLLAYSTSIALLYTQHYLTLAIKNSAGLLHFTLLLLTYFLVLYYRKGLQMISNSAKKKKKQKKTIGIKHWKEFCFHYKSFYSYGIEFELSLLNLLLLALEDSNVSTSLQKLFLGIVPRQ